MKNLLYLSLAVLLAACSVSCKKDNLDICTKMDDENFKEYCYKNFDLDGDHKVTRLEAAAVLHISFMKEIEYKSLKGIEYFTNLETLYAFANHVQYLDVTKNTKLTSLNCQHNSLTSLDVSKNTKLTDLNCLNNPLQTLYISSGQSATTWQLPEGCHIVYK